MGSYGDNATPKPDPTNKRPRGRAPPPQPLPCHHELYCTLRAGIAPSVSEQRGDRWAKSVHGCTATFTRPRVKQTQTYPIHCQPGMPATSEWMQPTEFCQLEGDHVQRARGKGCGSHPSVRGLKIGGRAKWAGPARRVVIHCMVVARGCGLHARPLPSPFAVCERVKFSYPILPPFLIRWRIRVRGYLWSYLGSAHSSEIFSAT